MLAAGASGVAVIVPCKIRDRTILVDHTGCYVKTGGPKARTAELCRIRIPRIFDCHFHHHDFYCLGSFRPEGGAKPAVTENLGEQMQGDLIEFLASTVSGKFFLYIPVFLCVDLRALAFPLP